MVNRARAAPPGLALHATAARVELLLKERARLLRDVSKKKQQVEQARAAAEREVEDAMSKTAPLVQRHGALVSELSALFDELLAQGRLSATAQKKVRNVRRSLELQGFLSPSAGPDEHERDPAARAPLHEDEDQNDEPWSEAADSHRTAGRAGKAGQARGATDPAAREVASAPQPGAEHRTLRDIFRSLARAVHPDRARQEPERERRTEVMKEVTRAYEEGDLARLVELEGAWQSERVLAGDGDPELRCRELERLNRELLDQLRQLTRTLRDVKRAAREASLGPIEQIIEQASHELDDLAEVCAFVRKFRDGKSTLSEFVRGPMHVPAADDEMARIIESLMLGDLGYEPASAPRGPNKRRRR